MDTVRIQKKKIPEHLLKYFRLKKQNRWILRNSVIWNKPNGMPSSVKDRLTNKYEPVFMLVKNKKYWYDLDAVRNEPTGRTDPITNFGKYTKHLGAEHSFRLDATKGANPGDVWSIPTQPYPEAHFATFPEKLILKPILSSCPEWICKKCGKARVRITDSKSVPTRPARKSKDKNNNIFSTRRERMMPEYRNTIGWTDCGCNAGWRAGIILDPFAGSGTTLAIAHKYHRQYIGYELNPKYLKFINKRLEKEKTLWDMKSE